jgi:WD40 repeat protein
VTCISFDEQRIISGSLDNNIKIWNLTSGVCLSTLDWKNSEGHTGNFNFTKQVDKERRFTGVFSQVLFAAFRPTKEEWCPRLMTGL